MGCGAGGSKLAGGNTSIGKSIIDGVDTYIAGEKTADDTLVFIAGELQRFSPEDTDDYEEFMNIITLMMADISHGEMQDIIKSRNEAAAMLGMEGDAN